ncbi:MAG TPA: transcriptional regulator, partial [Rhizobiaceae bacterium]|nr:transcriptional regulator [Rhizobiaceae bacterium]
MGEPGGSGLGYRFGDYLLDIERAELRRGAEHIAIEPQVFEVLVHLVKNQDRVVSAEELIDVVWRRRAVSPSALTSRINAVRNAVGDNGTDQKVIKTIVRRGYRFIGNATTTSDAPTRSLAVADDLHQDVLFCTSDNGVRLAYAKVGAGPPLVKTGNWMNHIEYDWESPVWSHLLKWLATGRQLIRYDARGNGLSDWDVQDLS